MNSYGKALTEAMSWIGRQDRALFVGQGVAYGGTFMSGTFAGVPHGKLHEWPVAEDMQLGACIGMSLAGVKPVSVFPRWNFLLLAANQLVNHLSALPFLSEDVDREVRYSPTVIVRVGVGARQPLDGGLQHTSDFTDEFEKLAPTVRFVRLMDAARVVEEYQKAWVAAGSTVLVEYAELYEET